MTAREDPPSVATLTGWRFPAYAETRLGNGLRILVYPCPGQFVASAALIFDVPLSVEPADIEGVAEMTARCLTRGTKGLEAEEFADHLASCGADLEASASLDAFAVRLTVPVTHLARGLDLMADAVVQPAFAAAEVAHERTLRLQEIEQAHAYPQHVANEQLNAELFGTARAARPTGGTAETVAAITRADVASYAASYLTPAGATLVLAGDFGGLDPVDVAARSFGRWEGAQPPQAPTEHPSIQSRAQLLLVDWPDAPQSTIRVAGPGVTRADPLWPAMFVANHAVGGSFSSRINTVLREEKGYTYGATSTLDSSRSSGVFSVSTAVNGAATSEAVGDILSLVAAAQRTLTDEEVDTAIRAVSQSAPLGFERAESVTGRVELLVSQQLPLDHVDANLRRIQAVTTESANAAYSAVVDPHGLTALVIGDARSARSGLAGLGYADLREVTPAWR
jgi:zinc protease